VLINLVNTLSGCDVPILTTRATRNIRLWLAHWFLRFYRAPEDDTREASPPPERHQLQLSPPPQLKIVDIDNGKESSDYASQPPASFRLASPIHLPDTCSLEQRSDAPNFKPLLRSLTDPMFSSDPTSTSGSSARANSSPEHAVGPPEQKTKHPPPDLHSDTLPTSVAPRIKSTVAFNEQVQHRQLESPSWRALSNPPITQVDAFSPPAKRTRSRMYVTSSISQDIP
jgi:hypothetical protein